MDPEAQKEIREDYDDKQVVAEIMARCFIPTLITTTPWEGFRFVGHEIRITEATDCYGAVVWPSALVLCYFLETNTKQYSMADKNVIEIGAGTGLVSIVASLLGAHVTATDLPELLGNLQYNISHNTKTKSKHLPQTIAYVKSCDLMTTLRSTIHYLYFTEKETEAERLRSTWLQSSGAGTFKLKSVWAHSL
ncbi:putative methyltransferase-like protein 21E isoform X2 [Nycticebus coucang]|uniref:putative methyltransferase-like protein 21E isoform X2 n=1 Tax=Nycticebus coucang TaxID=9470 RepID=UPI00234CCE54|nr:putative methyltransferase-like protein 21E isoform X2 [Nycticebus coucang]